MKLPSGEEGAMTDRVSVSVTARVLLGFVAGFFATLVFHQLMLALLWGSGIAPVAPFTMAPTHPFRVPSVISLSFWGGIWGIVFAFADHLFPQRKAYWVAAILFGAILPSLVALFMVFPLKGLPTAGGWRPGLFVIAFLVNGAWGLGTGIFLRAFTSWLTVFR
jgi:hypothetical protein